MYTVALGVGYTDAGGVQGIQHFIRASLIALAYCFSFAGAGTDQEQEHGHDKIKVSVHLIFNARGTSFIM